MAKHAGQCILLLPAARLRGLLSLAGLLLLLLQYLLLLRQLVLLLAVLLVLCRKLLYLLVQFIQLFNITPPAGQLLSQLLTGRIGRHGVGKLLLLLLQSPILLLQCLMMLPAE